MNMNVTGLLVPITLILMLLGLWKLVELICMVI